MSHAAGDVSMAGGLHYYVGAVDALLLRGGRDGARQVRGMGAVYGRPGASLANSLFVLFG
jgi:hypothetical protein